jgi:UDP-4-amino-4,6-dideoxy-N-acetyl-beta-L-altrosamine transaminase
MAFIPYSRQSISEEDIAAVCDVLRSEFLTQGPAIPAFERAFAERHRVAHAVAVSNATAGLHIACLALGVGKGTRVWTSPNSFLASANCALYCDADVDFVDIDPRSRNMSVQALQLKLEKARALNQLPRVVIPVDFAGLPCDLSEIRNLADDYGFKLLEDASHATGASYLGQPVASAFSDISVFSFHAVKIVTTAEGGIITTQDEQIAHRLRLLRSHGMTRDPQDMDSGSEGPWYYEQKLLGFNARMTDVQAALGLSQLARLDEMHTRRQELADRYDTLLAGLPLLLPVRLPDRLSAWHLYPIEINDAVTTVTRAQVFQHMRDAGIGVNVHYIPIHTQPYYARLGFKRGDFPISEQYYSRAISLPLFPGMTHDQQQRAVNALRSGLAS